MLYRLNIVPDIINKLDKIYFAIYCEHFCLENILNQKILERFLPVGSI